MPNWAYNTLTVYGKQSELHEFNKSITSEDGSTSLVILNPMPDALKNTESPWAESPEPHPNWANLLANGDITQEWHDHLCQQRRENHEAGLAAFKETGYHNWHEWAIENWGTKWAPSDTWAHQMVDALEIKFSSPWSPPVALIETIAEQNPDLSFVLSFTEEADQFMGAILFKDGQKKLEITYAFDDRLLFPDRFHDRYNAAIANDDLDELHEIYLEIFEECVSTVTRSLLNIKQ